MFLDADTGAVVTFIISVKGELNDEGTVVVQSWSHGLLLEE